MKSICRLYLSGVFSFLLAFAAGAAIAQPQAIGQGPASGAQNAGPAGSQDAAAQVQGLTDQIGDVETQINNATKEMKKSLDDLKKLRASRPAPPKGGSPEEKAAYRKSMSDWEYKATGKEHEVYLAHAKLDQLQQKLKYLEQQLAKLQGKASSGSGNR